MRKTCTYCKKKRNIEFLVKTTDKIHNKSSWICKDHTSILTDVSTIRTSENKPVFIELFSGSQHISNYAQSVGFEAISIDNNPKLKPTICKDIQNVKRNSLPGTVAVVWASIPCTTFSIMAIANQWDKISIGYRNYYYIPKTKEAIEALRLVNKTLNLIAEINPIYYFIENPRGALRHFPQLKLIPYRHTVSYSDYGFDYYKPTDIFTNNKEFNPKPIKTCVGIEFEKQVKNLNNAYERSLVPQKLIEEIFDSFLNKLI